MESIFTTLAVEMGVSIWLMYVILTWSFAWKLAALWKSARRKSLFWFIILAIVNTVGILEILYIFVFSKMHHTSMHRIKKSKKVKKKKK